MKVCLVGSSGGHLTHLYMLKPFWKDKERFWVTFDKEDARSLLEGEKMYPCYYPTNRSLKALIINTKIAWKVLRSEKPDLIISCGAAPAVPFFYLGKLMGAKLIYIEVFDRIDNNNIGLVESLNRALGFSHGDYIARMDADDISEPSRIKKQVSCIEQKNLDLIGSSLILIDEQDVQFGTLHFPTRNEQIVRFMKYGTCLPHPTWLGKKEVFDCLHGYRKALYCEDYDFLLRVLKRGYKVGNCDGYDLRYRVRKCGISQSNYVKQYVLRKYLYKHRDIILQVDEEDILLYLNSDKFEEACLAYLYDPSNSGDQFCQDTPLNYKQYLNVMRKSKAMLDVPHPEQEGPTTRSFDALLTKTKVITVNPHIKEYPIYSENIMIVDRDNIVIDDAFIKKPYIETGYQALTISDWLKKFNL